MKRNFMSINIPKLPVFTTEEAIKVVKSHLKNLKDWVEMAELMQKKFKGTKELRKSGIAGIFSASLELTKEGMINISQEKDFGKILIKEKK